MGWTKGEIVQKAYAELALAGYVYDLEPEEMQEALTTLDLQMAEWQTRGIEWQPDFAKYEFEVGNALAKDQPRRIVNMSTGGGRDRVPGVVVPEGHWNL